MMRILVKVVIVVLSSAAGIALGFACREAYRASSIPPSSTQSGRTADPKVPNEALCGPKSLWVAAMRLGMPVDWDHIVSASRPTASGTSLGDLKRAASEIGLDPESGRLTWDELCSLRTTSILFLDPDHFVTADPREVAGDGQANGRKLRIYDSDKASRWWSREDLERSWSGAALVLRSRESGRVLTWDTCLIDLGHLQTDDRAEYVYKLRNGGNREVAVELAGTSCGCTAPHLSRDKLPPGESLEVRASVDVRHKRGPFRETVKVVVDDGTRREFRLVLGGTVKISEMASADRIYLGDILPDREAAQGFYLHDFGDSLLRVRSARLEIDRPGGPGGSVRFRRVAPDSSEIGTQARFPVAAGDYRIDLAVLADEHTPLGPFSGRILVETNLEGEFAQIRVPVVGSVQPSFEVNPKAVLVSLADPSTHRFQLRVSRVDGKRPILSEVVPSKGAPFTVKMPVADDGGVVVRVPIEWASGPSPIGFQDHSVTIHFQGGQAIKVPVVVVK